MGLLCVAYLFGFNNVFKLLKCEAFGILMQGGGCHT